MLVKGVRSQVRYIGRGHRVKKVLPFQPIKGIWPEETVTFLEMPIRVWDWGQMSSTAQRKFGLLPCLILCLRGNHVSVPGLKNLALKKRSTTGNLLFKCLVISFNCIYLFLSRQYILIFQNLKISKAVQMKQFSSYQLMLYIFMYPFWKIF